MKRIILTTFTVAAMLGTAISQPGTPMLGDEEYNLEYDMGKVEEVAGEVTNIDTLTPEEGGTFGKRLWIMTKFGPEVVSLGPSSYMPSVGIRIRPHDMVWVTGARVTKPDDAGDVILARQVRTATRTWTLRDERGHPFWRDVRSSSERAAGRGMEWKSGMGMERPGMGMDRMYSGKYDATNVMTFEGKVTRIQMVPAMHGFPAGTHVYIDTVGEQDVAIHFGPEWAMYNQNVTIKAGDDVKVTGAVYGPEDMRMVVPSSITVDEATINLRDSTGKWMKGTPPPTGGVVPLTMEERMRMDAGWKSDSAYYRAFDADKLGEWNGKVDRIETFDLRGSRMPGTLAMVTVGDETFPVHLGPAEFVKKQPYRLQPGDTIMIKGSRVTWDGRPVIIATEIHRGTTAWIFRDATGAPVWIGR
ncbi:MAG: hypothetical protein ACR2HJ_04350 [Fimbriimonadales bacterium]